MVGQVKKKTRKRPEPISKFAVGDRVQEVRKTDISFFGFNTPPEQKELSLKILGNLREGSVIGVSVKVNKRGSRTIYVSVIWDGFRTPSGHAQHRLTRLGEIEK